MDDKLVSAVEWWKKRESGSAVSFVMMEFSAKYQPLTSKKV